MNKNLFLVGLAFLGTLWSGLEGLCFCEKQSQAYASSSSADPLLTGDKKNPTQSFSHDLKNSDVALGPHVMAYIGYCGKHHKSCDLAGALLSLASYVDSFYSFKLRASVNFHIPEEFIRGIFDDFQNPDLVPTLEAIFKTSNRKQKEEAEAAKTAVSRPMDLSSLSSDDFVDPSSSASTALSQEGEGYSLDNANQLFHRKSGQKHGIPVIHSH